jgi:hypothetical protein
MEIAEKTPLRRTYFNSWSNMRAEAKQEEERLASGRNTKEERKAKQTVVQLWF